MELWNGCLVNESQIGKFDLFFGLHLAHHLFSDTDNPSKSLQSEKIPAASRLAHLTISLFQSLRVEESFESFYNVVLRKMKELPYISEPKLP